jgi:hypothetical protein
MNKNSKNKRIFEVLWTVDAVLRLLESHYCILRWKTPEIAGKTRFPGIPGKTRISGYSRKIIIPET